MKNLASILILLSVILVSCHKETDTPAYPVYPSYFPAPVYQFTTNKLTENGFLLGRKLFFDPFLSKDGSISCASCHHPNKYFADEGMAISEGVGGKFGIRNAPSITNTVFTPAFMWDGGVAHLDVSALPALTDTNEMAETMAHLIEKLNNHAEYPALFEKAFGSDSIYTQVLFYAFSQYVGSVVSASAKYDKVKQGKASFTQKEQAGYAIFKTQCNTCHTEPLFTNYSYKNNGLDNNFSEDLGRGRITLSPADEGKFRVPSLRNVMQTAPYMHGGRFATINEVLNHYTNGIVQSATLDESLQNGISLSEADKTNLILFLHTLTDEDMRNNSKYYE
ncbi:MAG: cytochrome c peroxidase [Chitinophagales bacterium]